MKEQKEKHDFIVNELCWAKIKGYPWWPAIIKDIFYENNKKIYFVGYFCEKNGSPLKEKNIKKWIDNYELFKGGSGTNKNDFFVALTVANMYYEGKIDSKDHLNFLNKYQSNKDRHNLQNVKTFFKSITKEKAEKEENLKEKKPNKNSSSTRKLIGKKRTIKEKEEIRNKGKYNNNEGKINVIKDNEINIKQNDLIKIDNLVKNITVNVEQILIKKEKYQKFFEQECKEKNISIHDNKSIKTKIELIKYLQIISEVLNAPIIINNFVENINSKI